MTIENINCPSCKTHLLSEKNSGAQVLLCANCGTQFRRDGTWPVVWTSRKAIVSLVLGLLAFIGLFLIRNLAPDQLRQVMAPLIVAGNVTFLLGLWALGEIRREQHTGLLKGRKMAFLGASMGGVLSAAILVFPLLVTNNLQSAFRPRTKLGPPTRPLVIARNAVTIVASGASWKWFHPRDGMDPAKSDPDFHQTFFQSDFDDVGWQVGQESVTATGFGYGDAAVVSIGTPASGDRKTAYFRHRFTTTQAYEQLMLTFYRDDGVIIYLDGKEVGRDNISNAVEEYALRALNTIRGSTETSVVGVAISNRLEPGEHLLAISLHNSDFDSSDLRVGKMTLLGVKSSTMDQ